MLKFTQMTDKDSGGQSQAEQVLHAVMEEQRLPQLLAQLLVWLQQQPESCSCQEMTRTQQEQHCHRMQQMKENLSVMQQHCGSHAWRAWLALQAAYVACCSSGCRVQAAVAGGRLLTLPLDTSTHNSR
jgi:hypothetical protein